MLKVICELMVDADFMELASDVLAVALDRTLKQATISIDQTGESPGNGIPKVVFCHWIPPV
jgi:hypothetical protein